MQQAVRRNMPWEEAQQQSPIETPSIKRTYLKKKSLKNTLVRVSVLLFLFALLLVFLEVKGATLGYQINTLKQDIAKLEAENSKLEYQIAQKTSLNNVEQIAIKDLEMYKPDAGEAMLIAAGSFTNDAGSENEENNTVNENDSFLSKLNASILTLAEIITH